MTALTGANLTVAERARQVGEEGWSPEHDREHPPGTLSFAAFCYLQASADPKKYAHAPPPQWPWEESAWKPGPTKLRMLVKAAALVCAELDRMITVELSPEDRERQIVWMTGYLPSDADGEPSPGVPPEHRTLLSAGSGRGPALIYVTDTGDTMQLDGERLDVRAISLRDRYLIGGLLDFAAQRLDTSGSP